MRRLLPPLLLPFFLLLWDIDHALALDFPSRGLPSFREAPAFRNGHECISPSQSQSQSQSQGQSRSQRLAFDSCDPLSVHIAMTLDSGYLRGSVAAILSIVQHAACPENTVFHFLASGNEGPALSDRIRTTFPYLRFKVYRFDEELVKERISSSVRRALEHPLNYARTYIPDILPACVRRVVYLDSDVVLVDDIAKLWGIRLGPHALGAPEYCRANFSSYFAPTFWSDPDLQLVFRGRTQEPCYFNTGVMVMDLERWRARGYSRAIEVWMERQKRQRIYELGSLPPFLLVFAGELKAVEHRWNQHGLGGDNFDGRCRPLHPGPVSLLHWSGKGKPWIRLDARMPCPADTLWAAYDLFIPTNQHHPN